MNHSKSAEMASPIDVPRPDSGRAKRRRLILAATIGNVLEWYDFLIYGLLSLTISKLFFPAESELGSLLLSMATFGAGFAVRPIGAVVLGIYADRVGRKAALSLSILLMALGTGLIAVVPTYESIGSLAPALMVLARLLQGFSSGGEPGGAIGLLAESAPLRQRGFYASWQTAAPAAGFMFGALVVMAVTLSMSQAELEAGGWRGPFVVGLLIAPVGLYIRSKLEEPELFLQARDKRRVFEVSNALERRRHPLLTGLALSVMLFVSAHIVLVYMPIFAVKQLGLSLPAALLASVVASGVVFVGAPVAGAISDRIGRKPMLWLATIAHLVLAYPAFMLMTTFPNVAVLMLSQSALGLFLAIYGGPAISALSELFPTSRRATAVGLVYNLTAAVTGGFAPFIVTWLIATTGDPRAPAIYMIGAALISGTALLWWRDRYDEQLRM